jgi:ribosomal protein S18 acetylase RimI-like enzyme
LDRDVATIVLGIPDVADLGAVTEALRKWQVDGSPFQLHPGDLGWFGKLGAAATAAAVRTWSRGDQLLAVGLLDGPDLLRLAIATEARSDEQLARQIADDLDQPDRGVLGSGRVRLEAPTGALVHAFLSEERWRLDERWTPLRRDLAAPVEGPGIRVEVIDAEQAHVRASVHRGAFEGSTFTDAQWRTMAAAAPYADARCLVAYDDADRAVAAVTVWSAGPGRPGLLEPMGVHRDHRRQGHGRRITIAAAAALRELECSSALVCTPSSNHAAVATYSSAGFERLADRRDRCRNG